VAASSRDQAEILYRQAEGFVLRTPRLRVLYKCLEGYRRIRHLKNRSRIQVFAADAKTGDGIIATLAVIEELHRHKDLTLYRTWRGKMRKRKGSQILTISTAGEPYSEFEETRQKIRQLPGAKRTDSFVRVASDQIVLHDWALPEKADVTDITLVKRANPFSAITSDSLQEDFDSPTMTINHWSRFKCNLPTRSVQSAINELEWSRSAVTEQIPEGQVIEVGLDVGWKYDSTAIVPLWPRDRAFRLLGPATILTPPRDGSSLNPKEIHDALAAIHERNPIHTVVMDITRAEETAQWIQDEIGCEVIEWEQSNAQAPVDYEKFMTGLRSGWLKHSGDRGLTRHVMNAVARMLPNGKVRFERATSTRQGGDQEARIIDALVAAAMVNAKVAADFGEDTEVLVAWA
jgi:phage terminase large subunit-like protein